MGEKIYIVTAGEYSDYHIVAVTRDKDKAETIKKLYQSEAYSDDAEVEEWEDDVIIDKPIYQVEQNSTEINVSREKMHSEGSLNQVYFNKWFKPTYTVYVQADDEEHAKKIAFDLIAKYKAEKEGL